MGSRSSEVCTACAWPCCGAKRQHRHITELACAQPQRRRPRRSPHRSPAIGVRVGFLPVVALLLPLATPAFAATRRCPRGQYEWSTGDVWPELNRGCLPCPVNTYWHGAAPPPGAAHGHCRDCPAGKFQPNTGMLGCRRFRDGAGAGTAAGGSGGGGGRGGGGGGGGGSGGGGGCGSGDAMVLPYHTRPRRLSSPWRRPSSWPGRTFGWRREASWRTGPRGHEICRGSALTLGEPAHK